MSNNIELLTKVIDRFESLKYTLLKAQTFDPVHYGFPDIYYKIMETDYVRVNAFVSVFEKYNFLKDAVVCEAGVGTLALSKYFLPFVKKAYLIETNPNVREEIEQIISSKGWAHKVELIYEDALTVELPEPVDFLIGELMSIYCANELQVQIFQHLRKFLKPDGVLIPEQITNLVQLGKASFEEGHTHYPILFTRHWPTLISSMEVVNVIDLYKEDQLNISTQTPIKIHLTEEVNCVYLNSWIKLNEGINFTGTDSLMPPTVKSLKRPVNVIAGETVLLNINFTYGTSLNEASFEVLR